MKKFISLIFICIFGLTSFAQNKSEKDSLINLVINNISSNYGNMGITISQTSMDSSIMSGILKDFTKDKVKDIYFSFMDSSYNKNYALNTISFQNKKAYQNVSSVISDVMKLDSADIESGKCDNIINKKDSIEVAKYVNNIFSDEYLLKLVMIFADASIEAVNETAPDSEKIDLAMASSLINAQSTLIIGKMKSGIISLFINRLKDAPIKDLKEYNNFIITPAGKWYQSNIEKTNLYFMKEYGTRIMAKVLQMKDYYDENRDSDDEDLNNILNN